MNPTELMLQEINSFLKAVEDPELENPRIRSDKPEIELLIQVRGEYIKRPRQKMPLYRLLPAKLISDLLLKAYHVA